MRTRSLICGLLSSCLVLSSLPARAELIGTPQLLSADQAQSQRQKVGTFLARADVQQQFVALGVEPAQAAQRVASMTDQELQEVSDRIDALPAGAGALELVLIILLILIVLELLGAINIFTRL